jgi:hypothetical protein
MPPVPIDLPLRPSEAAALAALIYEQVGERRLTDDTRSRLAGRAAAQAFRTVRPYFGSLEADPTHPATYYLAVDGLSGDQRTPLLLHMTPASSPASGIFPKPLLIGRMRPTEGREIVMNAISFGPDDTEAVTAFAGEVSRSFLPRAHGPLPLIWVDTGGDANAAVDALLAFRSLHRLSGLNIAGLRANGGAATFWPMVWAAIRSGYRDGYSLAGPYGKESARLLSCFRIRPEEAVEAVHSLRSVRGGVPFDVELDARMGLAKDTVELLKSAGALPQFVLTNTGEVPHGALPSLEIAAESEQQLRQARQVVHGACAVTVCWNGRDPAAALLLDALR